MKKFIRVLLFAVFASCASAPTPPPEWVLHDIDAVYPREAYIAQPGRGKTKAEAELDAIAALSRFFRSDVSSHASSADSWTSAQGFSSRLDIFNKVDSAARLFAIRYAKPWYNERDKEWQTVAYIDREEAWAILEPQARRLLGAFRALWDKAESERAPLQMFFDYKTVQNFVQQDEFINVMAMGELIHPAKMNALAGSANRQAASLPAKINEARGMASIFLDISPDNEGTLKETFTRLFSGEGLIITKTKNGAGAVCLVTVDEGFQQLPAGYFYTPRITVEIRGRNAEALFSYAASPGREGARSAADVAKRRAYSALAGMLEENFTREFNKTFELKK